MLTMIMFMYHIKFKLLLPTDAVHRLRFYHLKFIYFHYLFIHLVIYVFIFWMWKEEVMAS
jgi:hypothetical protein